MTFTIVNVCFCSATRKTFGEKIMNKESNYSSRRKCTHGNNGMPPCDLFQHSSRIRHIGPIFQGHCALTTTGYRVDFILGFLLYFRVECH